MTEKRQATTPELRHLFHVYVDDRIRTETLLIMRTAEMRRLIALCMYRDHVVDGQKNVATSIKIIGQVTGYSRQYLYDLCR